MTTPTNVTTVAIAVLMLTIVAIAVYPKTTSKAATKETNAATKETNE